MIYFFLNLLNINIFLSTGQVSGSSEDKDKMEQARAHLAITSPLVPVIEKCIRGSELSQLDALVPRLVSLAKSVVGLTPRVTLLHTVSLLAVYKQQVGEGETWERVEHIGLDTSHLTWERGGTHWV